MPTCGYVHMRIPVTRALFEDRDGSGAIEADEFPMLVKVLVLALTIELPVSDVASYVIAAEEEREVANLKANGRGAAMPIKPTALPPLGGGGKRTLRPLRPPLPAIGEAEGQEEEEEEGEGEGEGE